VEILTTYKIPVGWLLGIVLLWLKVHAAWLFAAIRFFIGYCLDNTLYFLIYFARDSLFCLVSSCLH